MDGSSRLWLVLFLILSPVLSNAWRTSREDRREPREPREMRRGSIHYHSKRHMLPQEPEPKKRVTTPRPMREMRKKPSGHLTPLKDDEMENDEVVSVAIGPPAMRPKYEKTHKKQPVKPTSNLSQNSSAVELVKNVLSELGKELLTRDVNENFVFGQYIGNSMKNLTSELRLSMQHDILELIVKYQKLNRGETKKEEVPLSPARLPIETLKEIKVEKRFSSNDTEEAWPDFSNLAKIVG